MRNLLHPDLYPKGAGQYLIITIYFTAYTYILHHLMQLRFVHEKRLIRPFLTEQTKRC